MSARQKRAVVALGVLLLVVGVVPRFLGRANPDVAWLVYVGERVLAGTDLYGSVVETNPPLAVWITLPAAVGDAVSPFDALPLFHALVALAAGAVLLYARRLLRARAGESDSRREFLAVVAVGFFLVPGLAFGQREHLAVLATFPYLLSVGLTGAGRGGTAGSDRVRGALAGLGFALKPHFLIAAVAAEAWLWLRRRDSYRLLRTAPLAMVATLVAYGGAMVAFEADYFRIIGDLLLPYYPYNFPRSLVAGLGSTWALVTYACVLATLVTARIRAELDSLVAFFLILAVLWLAAAVVQRQTFGYHYLPAILYALFALGASLTDLVTPRADDEADDEASAIRGERNAVRRTFAGTAVLALFVGVFAARGAADLAWRWGEEGEAYDRLRATVRITGGDSPVVAGLNFSPWPAFPLVNETGAEWAPRHPVLWLITSSRRRALALGERGSDVSGLAPLTRREERFRDQYVADLVEHRPDVLLVPRHDEEPGTFDVFRYFLRDRRFARWLDHYRPVEDALGHHVWVREGSLDGVRYGGEVES